MHRATPLNTSIRAYTAGGSRSVVDKVDDEKLMQEMGGNFMANETRSEVESPQNYGFTSVVFDAEKGQGRQGQGQRRDLHRLHGRQPIVPGGGPDG